MEFQSTFLAYHALMKNTRFCYILDDYSSIGNFKRGDNVESNCLANWLEKHRRSYKSILASQTKDEFTKPIFRIIGGVSDAEWLAILVEYDEAITAVATNSEETKDELIDRIDFITGRIPLIVKELLLPYNDNPNVTWDDISDAYDVSETSGAGGKWIKDRFKEFSEDYLPSKGKHHRLDSFMDLVTKAIIDCQFNNYFDSDVDFRFFYKKGINKVVVPICGYVRHAAVDILKALSEIMLQEKLDHQWIINAKSCNNNSILGFAFENYCVH